MIYGVGIDTIEVGRVRRFLQKQEGLKEKLFSPAEIEYCESKISWARSYAARYAAKEAFLKALGAGLVGQFSLRDIEVVNQKLGQPKLILNGQARRVIRRKKIKRIQVSLSHLKQIAIAIVVLER
jgi:holo-[acyl-carrier protein] synthase